MQLSNLSIRTLTAIVGIPIILLTSMYGGVYFLVLILLFSMIAQYEFYRIVELKGAKPQKIFGLISGAFLILAFLHNKIENQLISFYEKQGIFLPFPTQMQLIIIILLVSIILIMVFEMFRNNGSAIVNISTTILGILYISFFLGTLVGIRELFTIIDFPVHLYFDMLESSIDIKAEVYKWGGYTVASIFSIIWICDTMAYFGGMLLGKHKLFERISPKKTWEGAILGFIFAIISAMGAKYLLLEYLNLNQAIVIGFIIGTIGQIGDLIESLIKRDAGVKDSSSIIPGHGGFFDRFDSLILTSPVLYLYFDFIIFS